VVEGASLMGMDRESASSTVRQRRLLGVGVFCLAVAAAVAWWQGQPETGSILLRSCLLLGAVWLAYPSLRTTRWGVVLAVAGGAVLLLTRWRLVAGLILGLLAVALFWGRIRRRGASP
jgi:hypothetical protein